MNTSILHQASSHPQTSRRESILIPAADLLARIALAAIFLLAGFNKTQYYEANAQYLASGGLPEFLLMPVIIFEIAGALALIAGFHTRLVALAFAGFSILTALLYHQQLSDQMQFIMFFKNIAMAGGFLMVAIHGAGKLSLDFHRNK